MKKFKVGDRVTTKEEVEALYSRMYHGKASAYPCQWFKPGMVGTVVATSLNTLSNLREFQ